MKTSLALLLSATMLSALSAPEPELKTYKDAILHFAFSYPGVLKGQDSLASEAMDTARDAAGSDAAKAVYSCITMPLMAMDPAGETGAMLMIRVDFDCLKAPISPDVLPTLAQSSLSEGLAKLGKATLGTPIPYKLDGHDAVFIAATVTPDDKDAPGNGDISCFLIEKSAVCLVGIASGKTATNSLMKNLITFEGRDPHPLVPADVLAK